MCRVRELPRIRQGVQRILNDPANSARSFQIPEILLICTVKRHHTRFFQSGKQYGNLFDRNGNPVPGCMVNRGVTLGEGSDFFLFSHNAIKGTSKPTHYVVLHDDTREHLVNIAAMMHALCYLFQRATRSVSLAPPSYYADLAAERARCYVRNFYVPTAHAPWVPNAPVGHPSHMALDVHQNFTNNMFYI